MTKRSNMYQKYDFLGFGIPYCQYLVVFKLCLFFLNGLDVGVFETVQRPCDRNDGSRPMDDDVDERRPSDDEQ